MPFLAKLKGGRVQEEEKKILKQGMVFFTHTPGENEDKRQKDRRRHGKKVLKMKLLQLLSGLVVDYRLS